MGIGGWGESLQITPWGSERDSKNCRGAREPIQFHPTSHLSDGKTEAQGEKRELAEAAQQVLSGLLPRMGTDATRGPGHLCGLQGCSVQGAAE